MLAAISFGFINTTILKRSSRTMCEPHEPKGIKVSTVIMLHTFPKALIPTIMVITVEPGLYQTGHGGCRVEDEVLVTENGTEVLNTYARKWW